MIETLNYNNEGVRNFLNGNFQEAKKNYQKAIEDAPQNSSAFNNLGFLLFQEKQWDKAIEYYQQSLSIDPESESALLNISNIFLASNDFENAKLYIEKLIKINPQNPSAWETTARIALCQNKIEFANEAWQKAIFLQPQNLVYRIEFANLLFQTQQYNQAISQYQYIVEKNPIHKEALLGLGIIYLIGEEYFISRQFLLKILLNYPTHLSARHHLAMNYFKENLLEEGIQELKKILEIYPNEYETAIDLAVIYLGIAQYQLAETWIGSVLDNYPNHSKAGYYKGVLKHLQHKNKESCQILSKLALLEDDFYGIKSKEYLDTYFQN